MRIAGDRRGAPDRGAVARSHPRAQHAGAAGAVQAARRLAEGGAADGARRGSTPATRWRRPACCTRPGDLPGASWATRTQAAELFARTLAARSRARRGGRAAGRALLQARRSGPSCCRCWRCWSARPSAGPRRELALLHYRLAKAADQLGDTEKALATTSRPTTSTRPTCRPCWTGRRCCTGSSTGTRPSSSTRPSWSTTARRRRTRTSSRSSTASADQAEDRRADQGDQHVREGAGDPAGPPADPGGADRHLHPGQRLGGGHPPAAGAAGPHRRRRRASWRSSSRSATSTGQAATTRRRRSPPTWRRWSSSRATTSCCTTCWISSPRPSSGRRRWRSC